MIRNRINIRLQMNLDTDTVIICKIDKAHKYMTNTIKFQENTTINGKVRKRTIPFDSMIQITQCN